MENDSTNLSDILPAKLVLKDDSGRSFGVKTEEEFQKIALSILRERADDGSFYPTYGQLHLDKTQAFSKLTELYGTVSREEAMAMEGDEKIKALEDCQKRCEAADQLDTAAREDTRFIQDLDSIFSYSEEELSNDSSARDYVYQMAAFLLFQRRDYANEGFEFEKLIPELRVA